MGALTPKQERFIEEYLIDLNATQAAIRAGYSKKTAKSVGSENLTNPDIALALDLAKEERSKKAKITALWVLERLFREATADLADLYDEGGRLKPITEWPLVWRQGLVQSVEVDEVHRDGDIKVRMTKVKISDRLKRIELIGKHIDIQAFAERKEDASPGGGSVEAETVSRQEAARMIAFIFAEAVYLEGKQAKQD